MEGFDFTCTRGPKHDIGFFRLVWVYSMNSNCEAVTFQMPKKTDPDQVLFSCYFWNPRCSDHALRLGKHMEEPMPNSEFELYSPFVDLEMMGSSSVHSR